MPRPRLSPHKLLFALLAMLLAAAAPVDRIPPGPLGEREVTVVNHGPHDIVELYVSPSSADAWGIDRLGDRILARGARLTVKLERLRDCGFDLLAVYDDASREEVHAANLCRQRLVTLDGSQATPPPPPPVPEQHVSVFNAGRLPIQQLYIAAPDAAQWGDDLLASGSLSVEEERRLTYRGPCEADVRIVFSNRAAEERHGLNLCRLPTLRIVPGWTTEPAP